jgi:hypothetical protein
MTAGDRQQAGPGWIDRVAKRLALARNASTARGPAVRRQSAPAPALNDAATAEGLLVTLLGVARTKATDLALDETTIRNLRGAQCAEEAHFNNLVTAGAEPSTRRYTIPDRVFENATSFLTTWLDLEQIMVGMYMAAARQMAADSAYDLVELAYQIGVVEGQHQALLRQILGERLPANRAFPQWQYAETATALNDIAGLGLIDGKGTSYDYPGPGDRYCRGITGLVAETAADQGEPDVTPVANDTTIEATPVDAASD